MAVATEFTAPVTYIAPCGAMLKLWDFNELAAGERPSSPTDPRFPTGNYFLGAQVLYISSSDSGSALRKDCVRLSDEFELFATVLWPSAPPIFELL